MYVNMKYIKQNDIYSPWELESLKHSGMVSASKCFKEKVKLTFYLSSSPPNVTQGQQELRFSHCLFFFILLCLFVCVCLFFTMPWYNAIMKKKYAVWFLDGTKCKIHYIHLWFNSKLEKIHVKTLGNNRPTVGPILLRNLEVTLLESTGFPRLGKWKEVGMEVWTWEMGVGAWEMGVGADGASQQSEFHFSRLQEHPKTVTHF